MITKLGIVAGEILTVLEEKQKPVSLEEVEAKIQHSNDIILMAFGWLVREGHVHIRQKDDKLYICCSSEDKTHCP